MVSLRSKSVHLTCLAPMPQKGFHIINASAGSGKTYTLVFQYLEQLLASPKKDNYQNMLAMTFTNKAVNEMKERILTSLSGLARGEPSPMKQDLIRVLAITEEEIQWRAALKMQSLLHNFGAFNITTLDSFTHGLVRTFAFDLGLSHSFEVVVDSKSFIREVVDRVIDRVGVSSSLTQLLTQFSLRKIADEKSWDVSYNLNEFAPLLLNENNRTPLQDLQQISLETFEKDRKELNRLQEKLVDTIQSISHKTLKRIAAVGLIKDDFPQGLLINHFERLVALKSRETKSIKTYFNNKLKEKLQYGEGLYKKNLALDKERQFLALLPELQESYELTRKLTHQYFYIQNLKKQWVPLSLLGVLGKQLETEQQDQNRRLLSRFNDRIASLVQDQPIPFIYERLGVRYHHFFIDEFQDTSVLQWKNLVPLVGNAIESDPNHSLVLVGDPKQAIYRWRGGDVQQFFNLLDQEHDFSVAPNFSHLETNYRSYDQLVAFNNHFFAFAAKSLENPQHEKMFSTTVFQKPNQKKGGTVAIHQIASARTIDERGVLYGEKVIALVTQLRLDGYSWKDIVILVRKKSEARLLMEQLQAKSIPALSSDSLLLGQAEQVQALIQFLRLRCYPKDQQAMKIILDRYWDQRDSSTAYHNFVYTHLQPNAEAFFDKLNRDYTLAFDWGIMCSLSVYESLEYCLQKFDFLFQGDVYLQRFLEVVFSFSKLHSTHPIDFLAYWEREEEQLNVQLPESSEAIQIMTVHKSKGLQFEVVIYPFLEDTLQPSSYEQVWYPINGLGGVQTPWARLSYSDSLAEYSPEGKQLMEYTKNAAALDALNLLYVGCTRAVAQLHLITRQRTTVPSHPTCDTLLSGFVKQQLKSEELQETFYWSNSQVLPPESIQKEGLLLAEMRNGIQWRSRLLTQRRFDSAARDFGILIHHLLGKIKTPDQLGWQVMEAIREGRLGSEDQEAIEKLLQELMVHPLLKKAFEPEAELWIERDIILPNREIIRPDRVVIEDHRALIMDFKTGHPQDKDAEQIRAYGAVIQAMGHPIEALYLVYTNPKVIVESIDPIL